jgi:ribonuclease T
MLEVCAIIIGINNDGVFYPKDPQHFHIEPFKGANLEPSALKFNGTNAMFNFHYNMSLKKIDELR